MTWLHANVFCKCITFAMRQHKPKLAKAFSRIANSLRLTDGIMRSPSIPSKVELSSKDCRSVIISKWVKQWLK